MKNWYIVLSCLMMSFYVGASSQSVTSQKSSTMLSQKEMHNRTNSFFKRLNIWKATLSPEQKSSVHDLLAMYDELRKEYRKNDRNAMTQKRLLDGMQALDHVMDNWSSFYEQYLGMQQFHDSVVTWQTSQPQANLNKNREILNLYKSLYNRYEQEPMNPIYLADLKKQQVKISAIMQ